MPLIPSTLNPTTSSNTSTQSWVDKLMGKTISDNHSSTSFAKKDLPSNHRVLGENDMASMDHRPERLNIHTDGEGVVKKVTHG
jgi:Peptidase inhibitor I78 family